MTFDQFKNTPEIKWLLSKATLITDNKDEFEGKPYHETAFMFQGNLPHHMKNSIKRYLKEAEMSMVTPTREEFIKITLGHFIGNNTQIKMAHVILELI